MTDEKSVKKFVGLKRTFKEMKKYIHDTMGADAYRAAVHSLNDRIYFHRSRCMIMDDMSDDWFLFTFNNEC